MTAREYDLRPGKRRTHAMLALCVAAALPLGWGIYQTQVTLANERTELLRAVERVEAQRRALDAQARANDGIGLRRGLGQGTGGQHVLMTFLDRLEDAWREDVGLLRVEVEPSRQRASMQFQVESPQRLLDFVARLRAALGNTVQVALERHGAASEAGRWPVAAKVTIQWP